MPNNYILVNDPDQLDSINASRVMVAVPLLYVFMTHYLFLIMRRMKGEADRKLRLDDQGKRLFLYGIAGLASINFLQNSVFMCIMAWITLVCVIINHCFVFLREVQEKYRNYGILIYYVLLFVWFVGLLALYIYGSL